MKKLLLILGMMSLFLLSCGKEEEKTKERPIQQTFASHLKGSGKVKMKFKEPMDEAFVDGIENIYLAELPNGKEKKLSEEDIFVSPVNMVIESKLLPLSPGEAKSYDIILEGKEGKQLVYRLDLQNIRPQEFVIRLLGKDGTVKKEKVYSYDEMAAMPQQDAYYSGGCVMHGLFSFKAKGILLQDLLKDAGIDFHEGMSMACRVVDAPVEIAATERNSNSKTGKIFKNPERYWIKPRFTDNFKHPYEELYGVPRYFCIGQWEDPEIAKILADDKSHYSFKAREALASREEYLIPVEPMIAMEETSLQFAKSQKDIREFGEEKYGLFAEEIGFRFLYGAALDADPVINVTSFDKEKKIYPVVETPENAGKKAIEEGYDACGTSARQAKYVFGIDVFES